MLSSSGILSRRSARLTCCCSVMYGDGSCRLLLMIWERRFNGYQVFIKLRMTKSNKKALYIISAIFVIFLMYKIYYNHVLSKAIENSAIIIGKVELIENTRGATFVHVKYQFNGKIIHGIFDTYNRETLDSLKNHTSVILRVSKEYPEKYIEYVGIYDANK